MKDWNFTVLEVHWVPKGKNEEKVKVYDNIIGYQCIDNNLTLFFKHGVTETITSDKKIKYFER